MKTLGFKIFMTDMYFGDMNMDMMHENGKEIQTRVS